MAGDQSFFDVHTKRTALEGRMNSCDMAVNSPPLSRKTELLAAFDSLGRLRTGRSAGVPSRTHLMHCFVKAEKQEHFRIS